MRAYQPLAVSLQPLILTSVPPLSLLEILNFEPCLVTQACSIHRLRQEDCKFKAIPGYIGSLGMAWAAPGVPVSNIQTCCHTWTDILTRLISLI